MCVMFTNISQYITDNIIIHNIMHYWTADVHNRELEKKRCLSTDVCILTEREFWVSK